MSFILDGGNNYKRFWTGSEAGPASSTVQSIRTLRKVQEDQATQIKSNRAFNTCSRSCHHLNLSIILDKRSGLTQADEH
jgi:hypothetical protein